MWKLLSLLSACCIAHAQISPEPRHRHRGTTLCLYEEKDFKFCEELVKVLEIEDLTCDFRTTRKECLKAVARGHNDIVVLDEHDYHAGRKLGLKPVIFARELWHDYYIAVAPSNLSYVDYLEAPLIIDPEDHRAVHAGLFLNAVFRNNEFCSVPEVSDTDTRIRIINSAVHTPQDNEIMICPMGYQASNDDAENCNFEVSLQRAVFVNRRTNRRKVKFIKNLLDAILTEFHQYNDADACEGVSDYIFKCSTIGFDLEPTYLNGVTEEIFEKLHCDNPDQPHDPNHLG